MWQFVLAVAVAGSGFIASRLFNNADSVESCISERNEKCEQENLDDSVKPEDFVSPLSFSPQIPGGFSDFGDSFKCGRQNSTVEGGKEIFRFSSLGTCGDGNELLPSSKSSKKKLGFVSRGWRGNVDCVKRLGKKSGVKDSGDGLVAVVAEQNKKGKRLSFCLKKRRIGKNVTSKCGSCSSEGSTSFSWGLGVGIMYMVSAGKAEIEKLNIAINDTTKIVQQLKTELHKRKASPDLQDSSCYSNVDACPKKISGEHGKQVITKSCVKEGAPDETKVFSRPLIDDGEHASSVLTEEPEPEVLKMDQLEAELEFELQKIPWCLSEKASAHEGRKSDLHEVPDLESCASQLDTEHPFITLEDAKIELSGHEQIDPQKPEGMDFNSFQIGGVSPSELDTKLCHLLIEQQESHIVELESLLHLSQAKLHVKEAELQALKNCVRGLTDLSLETVSEEEIEEIKLQNVEHKTASGADCLTSGGLLTGGAKEREQVIQKPMVGMKRAMEFESCDC